MSYRARLLRALAVLAAVLLLAVAVPAMWARVTVYFGANFDQKGAPGQQAPLVADPGTFSASGPGFNVVPTSSEGGALLIEGLGLTSESVLTGTFEKIFKGSELQIDFTATVGSAGSNFSLRAIEDTDGEIIDLGWDGNGFVDVDGLPGGSYAAGAPSSYSLTLRDVSIGSDLWVLTITPASGVPVTQSGPLVLSKPLSVKAIKFVIPAGTLGTMLVDDVQVASVSFATNK